LAVLKELGSRSIQSVLVEGGAAIAGNFVDAKLINKVTFFVAPKIVGGREAPSAVAGAGIDRMADALELEDIEIIRRGRDVEITGYPRNEG
jgi:diaminohydroxyphosphoribosylaminopyrimidine deaminase/5-amino-6-(5-phosphoribosylamino)uracil reductase